MIGGSSLSLEKVSSMAESIDKIYTGAIFIGDTKHKPKHHINDYCIQGDSLPILEKINF